MKRIGILGAGTWGMALARMLTVSGNDVLVWSAIEKEIDSLSTTRKHPNLPQMKIPDELRFTKSIEEVCKDKDILLFAVPSVFVRSTAAKARPYVADGQIIVDVAKGIEPDTLYTMTEILADELGKEGGPKGVRLVALSGPTHAEEVAIDLPTTIVSASKDMEAAAQGSGLRAEVQPLKPGETYTKNGFDVVIKDANGNRIHQYQMKYGATAEDTISMLKAGKYNNQIIVVPEEQVEAVQKAFPNKTVTSTIGAGDVKSKPLTKEQAKKLQEQAQNDNFMDADWNDYVAKEIALGIGKQAGYACLQGAAVGAGMTIATKIWNGESINGEEMIETAIMSGADFGLKTATAGALKVASEKGIFTAIPKGTKGSTFANIAFVAIENVKVLGKVATGELTPKEGIDVMQQITCACVAGIAASEEGAALGASIGSVLGPVGAAVGGFIGGTVGYLAGSKVAQSIVKGVQKVRDTAVSVIKSVGQAVVSSAKAIVRSVTSLFGF